MARFSLPFLLCVAYYPLLSFSGLIVPTKVDCISTKALAPLDDCRAVLNILGQQGNLPLEWGRTVEKGSSTVKLPVGYHLSRLIPQGPTNKCEIYIDNRSDRWSQTSIFSVADLAQAGQAVLDQCYPLMFTGRAFPTMDQNVYVTTLFNTIGESRENVTLVDLGASDGKRMNTIEAD